MSEQLFRDSGQDWLGSIPNHWNLHKLGAHFRERKVTVNDTDYAALSVTMQGIVPQLETAAKSDANDKRKLVLKGDFVINSRSDRKGSSGISPLDGSVSQIAIVLEPKGLSPLYANYLLRSYPFQEEFYKWGSGIVADLWSTRFSAMKQILIPVPPRSEQDAIAGFLDRELEQIDSLVEKQKTLVALLEERASTLLKDAVRDYFGGDNMRLKHVANIKNGFSFDSSLFRAEGAVPVVRQSDFFTETLSIFTDQQPPQSAIIQNGDILVSLSGDFNCVIWQGGQAGLNQRCAAISTKHSSTDRHWLKFAVEVGLESLQRENVSTTISNMSSYELRNMNLCVPSPEIQKKVAATLITELGLMDELKASVIKMLDLLSIRKESLIAGAVTGKLGIRESNNG